MIGRLQRSTTRLMQLLLTSAALGAATLPGAALAEKALIIARDMDINALDPARAWCDTCQIYNTSVYEQLVTLDRDNKVVPMLATSWEISPDQKVFTFRLNPAATFSDGSAVEAADVKWSLERLKHMKASGSFLAEPIAAIETPDAATVVITLTEPSSEFLSQVSAGYMAIINSEVAAANGALADETAADKDGAETWFLENSAGSGPFVLTRYEPNSELRLTRNAAYWGEKPALPEVVFRQVKDAVAQAQMLQSGSVDLAMQIDPETARSLQGVAGVSVTTLPSFNFVYVALSPAGKGAPSPMGPEVREAISLGIDRASLIDFTLGGEGRIQPSPIPLGFPGGDGHEEPQYNPEKAKELLAAQGHSGGFTLPAIYPDLNVYGVDFSLMMQKIQQDLNKINVKLELQPVPLANWREIANTDHIPFTAVFFAPDFYGASQYVDVFGLSEGSVWANRAGGAKDPSILSTRTKELTAQALAAPDAEAAAKIWFEAGEEMMKARIILPMVSPNLVLAHGDGIKGVRYSACCNLPLSEITAE
ncbi:ABC transporter substrate-binding protein [Falsigemmobacter faecalis]|uniref:ABC transporter substrate-binding protein n=1 Tax=Falsigemmobacter faecalis TaxID=2488730 RepID=A0A3P3DPH5_9RHOB|nr:ABC transporter substrate-binding protein [Falsigemmobacter faecalis]RRH76130.1 ABC transporter substrate-binding protein [Falsigemmobacter faecalis]